MNIIENFKSAVFNILSSKMRTFLTTLGIIIGITAVILITSLGKGFKNKVNGIFNGIDTGAIEITTAYGKTIRDKDRFSFKDLEAISKIENISVVAPSYSTSVSVKLKDPSKLKSARLEGVNEESKELNKTKIKYGRFVNQKDRDGKSKVCVIDKNLAKDIFGRENAIGETVYVETVFGKIKDTNLRVIGIYDTEDTELYTPSIYCPIETTMDFLGNQQQLFESINAKLIDTKLYNNTRLQILKVLGTIHNTQEDKYQITANFQLLDTMGATIKIFTVFIGLVASISLLVGGIGIMNIMLVTVTERTREIGIRKALGATNSNIKTQFLIEAITVSLMGGVIGITFGYVGSFILEKILAIAGSDLKPQVSLPVVIGAVVVSSVIGIIFGVYPAGKAAKLDPIEALRYE